MHYAMIGAGAMGGALGTLLVRSGEKVTFIDIDREVVRAVSQNGFHLEGVAGEHQVAVRISAEPDKDAWADVAIVLTTTNDTESAAILAHRILKRDGFAVTLQNGIGNIEKLAHVLGKDRVVGGSTLSSAQRLAPGESQLTKLGPARVGEVDGTITERVRQLVTVLERAGFMAEPSDNVVGVIWSKLIHNAAINPICAATGLVQSETAKVAELEELRGAIYEEAMAIARAEGVVLAAPEPLDKLRAHVASKFTRPSMLQHISAGRRTEIDAINGAIVNRAEALGIATPANKAIVAVIKGLERAALLRQS